ncbi:MAG: hypothetical protein HRT45_11895 [Bdellovibrionales bacterium]|nr:hypothetical protein [Bdellovibrionales bacterium]
MIADVKLLLLIVVLLPYFVFAHEENAGDFYSETAYLNLAREAIALKPQPTESSSAAVIKVGSEYFNVNDDSIWQMAQTWLQIYYAEVKRDCDNCLPEDFDIETAIAETRNRVAEGFAENKIYGPLRDATEHVVEDSAMIGAKLGREALALKIASEIAETIASKSVGGAGVHVLCNMIDAVILFGMRHIQVAWRVPRWSMPLGAGRFMGLKYWVVKRSVHRAKKRMQLFVGPIELDDEGLEILNEEQPSGNRRFSFSKDSQRVRWMLWIQKKTASYDQQLQDLEQQLAAQPNSRGLLRKKRRLLVKRQNLLKVNYKGLFKSRKRKFKFLKGKGKLEPAINGNMMNKGFLWVMALQEGVLHRGLAGSVAQPQTEFMQFLNRYKADVSPNSSRASVSQNPIVAGIINEQIQNGTLPKENRELAAGLARDVLQVFDTSLSKRHRYFKTVLIEDVIGRLLYRMMTHRLEGFESDKKSWLGRVNQTFFFNWKAGTYARYIFEFTDFLRIASVSGRDDFLVQNKHEALEALFRVFNHLQKLDQAMLNSESATELMGQVNELNHELLQFRPWKEKRSAYKWVGLGKPVPQCSSMWEVH